MEYYDVAFSHKENGHTVNENIHLAVDKSSNVEYVFKQRIAPLGYKKIKILAIKKSKKILR